MKKRSNRIFIGDHDCYVDIAYNPGTKVLRVEGGAQRGVHYTNQMFYPVEEFLSQLDIPVEELKEAIHRMENGLTIFEKERIIAEAAENPVEAFCKQEAADGDSCCLMFNHVGSCQSAKMVNSFGEEPPQDDDPITA